MKCRPFWLGFGLALLVIASDQTSKFFVQELLSYPPYYIPVAFFFSLVSVWNSGVSFGFFDNGRLPGLLLAGISTLIAVVFVRWMWRAQSFILAAGLGLIIGGALSNALDRVRWKAVFDFIDISFAGWHFWAFNGADTAITVGACLLLYDSVLAPNVTKA